MIVIAQAMWPPENSEQMGKAFLEVSPLPDYTESPPAERVGSRGPPEGGVCLGKAPSGLFILHQVLTLTDLVHAFLDLECIYVWSLHPTQLC